MNKKVIKMLAELNELQAYHYKVIMYLMSVGEATQAEIFKNLNTSRQYINKICKELRSFGILEVSKVEGRNVFLKLSENPKLKIEVKGQIHREYAKEATAFKRVEELASF